MSEILIIGYNDFVLLGDGWHERAVDVRSGIVYRPSQGNAEFWLSVLESHRQIGLLLSASTTLIGEKVRLRLACEDSIIGEAFLEDDDWHILTFPVSGGILAKGGEKLKFTLTVSPTFIPHLVLQNGDFREMGIYLAGVRLLRE